MLAHGRQTATSLEGIREDHKQRYMWVAKNRPMRILDAGCGIGYGSYILAENGHTVDAYDLDRGAIETAKEHYAHENITFSCKDISELSGEGYDAAVCFEVLEHIEDPESVVKNLLRAKELYCSVPNEEVVPFEDTRPLGHLRHYTVKEFERLLGIPETNVSPYRQMGKFSSVESGWHQGRTILARAWK